MVHYCLGQEDAWRNSTNHLGLLRDTVYGTAPTPSLCPRSTGGTCGPACQPQPQPQPQHNIEAQRPWAPRSLRALVRESATLPPLHAHTPPPTSSTWGVGWVTRVPPRLENGEARRLPRQHGQLHLVVRDVGGLRARCQTQPQQNKPGVDGQQCTYHLSTVHLSTLEVGLVGTQVYLSLRSFHVIALHLCAHHAPRTTHHDHPESKSKSHDAVLFLSSRLVRLSSSPSPGTPRHCTSPHGIPPPFPRYPPPLLHVCSFFQASLGVNLEAPSSSFLLLLAPSQG